MKANTKTKRRRWWIAPAALLAILCIGSAYVFFADLPSRRELTNLEIGSVDFQNLRDSTYTGTYEGTTGHLRDASVEVTIAGGEITDIRTRKGAVDEQGNPTKIAGEMTVETLFDRVLAARSLQVDAVSSATLTSKAHLKALENALLQAQADCPE